MVINTLGVRLSEAGASANIALGREAGSRVRPSVKPEAVALRFKNARREVEIVSVMTKPSLLPF